MEKLHSQLPQPLKRCSPSRTAGDLLTQIKNSNSPLPNRSPARRIAVTSSPNNIRSRDHAAVATSTPKQPQPEVKLRSPPEVLSRSRDSSSATPTRRSKYSPTTAVNGNNTSSPVARTSKVTRQQQHGLTEAATAVVSSNTKQSPIKSFTARLPIRTKSAELRTLRSTVVEQCQSSCEHCVDDKNHYNADETVPPWTQQTRGPTGLAGTVSSIKKSLSPRSDRRHVDSKKPAENDDSSECYNDEKNNGGGGSPIYHELDPPGFPVLQHTYQSIVEISDELETLRGTAATGPEVAENQPRLSRARSAQELTAQKSPTRLSLFSRFRFATKKSASTKTSAGKVDRAEVKGQRSLQDVDLIAGSRDDVSAVGVTSHDRQPSFTTFAHRPRADDVTPCDADDGYSCVYVPSLHNSSHQQHSGSSSSTSASVPPRTSSLTVDYNKPVAPSAACEPLYRQKFLRIASVHTLQSPPPTILSPDDDDRAPSALTSSNSLGDLLMVTDVGHGRQASSSQRRVTSYDDHAVTTAAGSRNMAAAAAASVRRRADEARSREVVQRFGLSPGRGGGASFGSPSCGVRMAELRRGAARKYTGEDETLSSRSSSASTPVPSPRAPLSVFQFSVPPPGVMMSPPVHRAAYRHVSSQTVMSVRPPSAACVLSITAVHGSPAGGQMQTIEEEDDDDSTTNDGVLQPPRRAAVTDRQQPRPDQHHVDRNSRQNDGSGTRTDDVVRQSADKVAGGTHAEDAGCRTTEETDVSRLWTQSDVTTRTSKLRRPSPVVASKPLGSASSQLPDNASHIVPPTVSPVHRVRAAASSSIVSPPSSPRSVDPSQARPSGLAVPASRGTGESVRRPFTRGRQQQQRRQAAPPSTDHSDAAAAAAAPSTPGPLADSVSVSGGGVLSRKLQRRVITGDASSSTTGGSPNLSSAGSSLSLVSSTGSSEVETSAHAGPELTPDPSTAATTQARTSSPAGSALHQHQQHQSKYSSITSRVGKFNELTIPTHTDRRNY